MKKNRRGTSKKSCSTGKKAGLGLFTLLYIFFGAIFNLTDDYM